MATVPLVNLPSFGPSQPAGVRANPGMFAPLAEAQQRVAGAVSQFGDLAARVKHVTDTTYVIGAQAKLEAATTEFHAWAKQNPDTSTWDKEWEGRQQAVQEDIQKGSATLGPLYRQHLTAEVGAWQTRTNAAIGSLKTEQNLMNAAGTVSESVAQAVANNDEAGAMAAIHTAVASGVYHPTVGAQMQKRVRTGIATNVANADVMADPFTAAEKLEAKDEAGHYVNYPALPQPARVTMLFRASKLASETRSATMRQWQTDMANARQNGTPAPDEAGVRAEAERQGISGAWVDKLFKPETTFDPGAYANLRGRIMAQYDPRADTGNLQRAKLTEEIYAAHFPAHTQTELLSDLEKKGDPAHTFNSPTFREVMQLNEKNFTLGVYGKYEFHVKDPKTGETRTVVNKDVLRQAEQMKARVTDSLAHYVQQNPQASHEDVTKFMATVYRNQAAKTGSAIFKFNP